MQLYEKRFFDDTRKMQASSSNDKSETSKAKRERERKRLKKPKVKTGCKTCKIRRVKCDETHPECLRCQKFGKNYCDGYDYDSSAPGSRSPSQNRELSSGSERPILPRNPSSIYLNEPRRDPGIPNFSNEDEFRCFRVYRDEVAPRLSCFDRSVWNRFLLQTSQNHEFIRHALIAIGGFSRSIKTRGLDGMDEDDPSDLNYTRLQGFAIEHYNRFLAGTKSHMSETEATEGGRRLTMVSCLLVVCIENLQMHHQNALIHAKQGFKLLEEMKSADDVDSSRRGSSPPALNVMDDGLVQQFNRMQLQVLCVFVAQTGEQQELKAEGTLSIQNMPDQFADIDEARYYLDLVMRRTFHFMAYMLAGRKPLIRFKESTQSPSAFDDLEGLSQALNFTNSVQVEQYAAENRRWQKAFEPLFHSSLKDLDHIDAFRVLLLQVHSLATMMRLNSQLSNNEMIWDSFTPEMENLIRMSRTILHHPHADVMFGDGAFSFDMGLIFPLLTPAVSCRDRELRREAVGLLRMRSWREAQWISQIAADVGEFVVETEEEDVDTVYIPEWARARLTAVDVYTEERRATLHCIRGTGGSAVHIQSQRDWARGVGESL